MGVTMKLKWTKKDIEYFTRPLPKVERTYKFEVIALIVVIILSVITAIKLL